ncbi:cache domain-containing protein [Psychromonas sp. MME2]|uniref:cache domain-containing protein n=1 Tax=Psychromonas sp. MME2 TaxID=3231033 RepID=UPI00339BA1BC
MKNLGFSRKIILAASSIIALALIVLASINYITVMNHTQTNLHANLTETSHTASSNISNWLNGKLLAISTVAEETDEISATMDRSKLALINKAANFVHVYVANESGTMVLEDKNISLPADYDPRIRPWYTQAKRLNSASFTKPYVDATSGDVLLSAMAPINRNGRFVGVAASDLSLDFIRQTLDLVDFSGMGHVYLIADDGTILVHQNKGLIQKNINDIYTKDKISIQPELMEASSDAGPCLLVFSPLKAYHHLNGI